MLLFMLASLIFVKRPRLASRLGFFQITKDGDRVFVRLESILNFLCESNQLVFCGVVTSEASLALCDDVVMFELPVQAFVNHPLYQLSDASCQ